MSNVDALTNPNLDRDPVEELAEEFLRRRRQGEAVSITEYAENHPHLAPRIRDLFPTLLLMEDLKPGSASTHPHSSAVSSCWDKPIERLGDFSILREIGRGGMGVVYEAEQESLARRVALKVLPADRIASPTRLRRFHREAQAAARLHHTNIVPIFGFGQQDGLHYYVMQLIPGQGLDQVLGALSMGRAIASVTDGGRGAFFTPKRSDSQEELRREKSAPSPSPEPGAKGTGRSFASPDSGVQSHAGENPPRPPSSSNGASATFSATDAAQMLLAGPPTSDAAPADDPGVEQPVARPVSGVTPADQRYWRSVARIGIQVADALQYAHRQGTLHRDIKPANLLLDNRGTVWIADFGLAKLADLDDLTHSGDVVGTLRYMAPEQFEGKADARGDVYSLGLTLYELLALRPAFDEKDRGRLIRQVTQEEPPRPRKLNSAIPRDLETIVVKAIASHPEHRYQTAGELAADLKCFLEDRPIHARRVTLPDRLWRWCRRNRAMAALAGTTLALLVTVAVVASIGYLRTNQALERAEAERTRTLAEHQRAEANLHLATKAFEDIFGRIAADPVTQPPDNEEDEEWPEPAWETMVTDKDAALLESMLKFYDQFAEQNHADVKLQKETGRAYRRVGDIQRRLGQFAKAETAYRHALAMYERLAATSPDNLDYPTTIAAIHNDLGTICRATGRFLEARDCHLKAQEMLCNSAPQATTTPDGRFELARTYSFLSTMLPWRSPGGPAPPGPRRVREPGGRQEPVENNRKALEILQKLTQEHADNPRYVLALARSQRDRCWIAAFSGHADQAEQARQEALCILEKLVADFANNPEYRYELAETYAMSYPRRGEGSRNEASAEQLRRAVEIGSDLVARYPTVPEYRSSLARAHQRAAEIARGGQSLGDVQTHLAKAVDLERRLVTEHPSVTAYRYSLARSLHQLADVQQALHEPAKARASLEEAIANSKKIQESTPTAPPLRWLMAGQYLSLAKVLRELGEKSLADEAAAKAGPVGPVGPAGEPRGPSGFRGFRREDAKADGAK